jgi:UDP-glucose 4-epimerase
MSEVVLVTGGAGFIGSNLVRRLLADGRTVRVLDNFSTGSRSNLVGLDGVQLIEGDLLSYERVHNAVRGCGVVYHLGALPSVPRSIQDPITTTNVNVMGTLNVLLTARDEGIRRVVYASSSSVYGSNTQLPKVETMRPLPISPYAAAKLSGESMCTSFHSVYDLEAVSLRFFNVFGPRQNPDSQYSAVIPKFIGAAHAGDTMTIFGDGTQSRDFTFVDDVVSAVVAAGDAAGAAGGVFNIAAGNRHTLLDLIDEIGAILGVTPKVVFSPGRQGDVLHSQADSTRARQILGWEPVHTFSEGLSKTASWLVGTA